MTEPQTKDVLIVEDNKPAAKMIQRELEERGLTVEIASTLRAALSVVDTVPYLIILIDGNLNSEGENNGQDGEAVADEIRGSQLNNQAHLINISGTHENKFIPDPKDVIKKSKNLEYIGQLVARVVEVRTQLLAQRSSE